VPGTVVVGAGLAGLRTCEVLRQHGYGERISLVGAETHLPYSRPPLSKEVLRGDAEAVTAQLRDAADLAALELDLHLGMTATGLSVEERTVALSDGTTLPFDDCVVATGASPRTLPGRPEAFVLRTLDDCLALRAALEPGASVLVVGAGFIGLEVAAAAVSRECAVTVVDVLPTPLQRVFDPAIGTALQRLHEAHGVRFELGTGVDAVTADADVVVVGIGVTPATDWLAGSGLVIDDGVVCDRALRAGAGVWAVGDVARWPHPAHDGTLRVEHWTNATEQPLHVAAGIIAGGAETFTSVPYFWSDQYDAKLQSLGADTRGDETRLVAGSFDEPKWVALVRTGDRLSGVVGLRSAGRVMKLRPLLAAGTSWSDALAQLG
jgi:NADPH-dependent 2,4-dienoyl-CoA reductase/sulfur reductase-like enzyme